jgi:CO dehydrogenase nickel-insertion accessory protein CooC1
LLGQLEARHQLVVADFEAGLGTVLRMSEAVDAVVVVVQPTVKSLEVGARAVEAVRERGLGPVVLVGNRVRDDADLARVRAALPGLEPVVVPDDLLLGEAERSGRSPLDAAPHSAAVLALAALADALLPLP